MAVNIQSVGVIGAGQMGNGIAHVCALAGYSVFLNDLSADRIKAGMATINGNMAKQVGKKAITEDDRKAALARIKPAEKYDALSTCDLVIETATEKEEVKRKIFSDLCASLKIRRNSRHQYILDFDYAAGIIDRSPRAFHRHSLHESGAADGAGRIDPWHRHRRCDI